MSAAVFIAAGLYNFCTGLIVFMGDSYLLADRAKHLIQTGTLDVNNFGSFMYPPLYPIVVSPAYLSSSPAVSFRIILLLHALMVAAQVVPFYRLLAGYAHVAPRHALWLAALLSLAPATIPYESMMLTEVLYIPLLLWLTWLYLEATRSGSWAQHLSVGILLGLLLLLRPAASVVVLAYLGARALEFWRTRHRVGFRESLVSFGCSLGGLTLVYGTWKLFEAVFVHHQGEARYFTVNDLKVLFTNREIFDLHFAWFANTVLYYLSAPLCIAGCFVCVLFLRRFRRMMQDPLAPFAVLILLGSSLSMGLLIWFTDQGPNLTLNRYLMPYVFFLILIAIRHREALSFADLKICGLMLGLMFFTLRPSGLGVHFVDALAIFAFNTNPFHFPAAVNNLLFVGTAYVPAWLWVRRPASGRRLALILTTLVWLGVDFASMVYYRNSGDFNVTRYAGVAKEAAEYAGKHPGIKAYFDPELPSRRYFPGNRILFYWPKILTPVALQDLRAAESKAGAGFIYFTDQNLPEVGRPLGREPGPIMFYLINPQKLAMDKRSFIITLGSDLSGEESTQWSGKTYPVRWLRDTSDFEIRNAGPPKQAVVNLQLGIYTKPHTAHLEVNGVMQPENPVVKHVFWASGPQTVSYVIQVNSGVNHCRLVTSDGLDTLPGGRQVAFLLIGDIVATPVDGEQK